MDSADEIRQAYPWMARQVQVCITPRNVLAIQHTNLWSVQDLQWAMEIILRFIADNETPYINTNHERDARTTVAVVEVLRDLQERAEQLFNAGEGFEAMNYLNDSRVIIRGDETEVLTWEENIHLNRDINVIMSPVSATASLLFMSLFGNPMVPQDCRQELVAIREHTMRHSVLGAWCRRSITYRVPAGYAVHERAPAIAGASRLAVDLSGLVRAAFEVMAVRQP